MIRRHCRRLHKLQQRPDNVCSDVRSLVVFTESHHNASRSRCSRPHTLPTPPALEQSARSTMVRLAQQACSAVCHRHSYRCGECCCTRTRRCCRCSVRPGSRRRRSRRAAQPLDRDACHGVSAPSSRPDLTGIVSRFALSPLIPHLRHSTPLDPLSGGTGTALAEIKNGAAQQRKRQREIAPLNDRAPSLVNVWMNGECS